MAVAMEIRRCRNTLTYNVRVCFHITLGQCVVKTAIYYAVFRSLSVRNEKVLFTVPNVEEKANVHAPPPAREIH